MKSFSSNAVPSHGEKSNIKSSSSCGKSSAGRGRECLSTLEDLPSYKLRCEGWKVFCDGHCPICNKDMTVGGPRWTEASEEHNFCGEDDSIWEFFSVLPRRCSDEFLSGHDEEMTMCRYIILDLSWIVLPRRGNASRNDSPRTRSVGVRLGGLCRGRTAGVAGADWAKKHGLGVSHGLGVAA